MAKKTKIGQGKQADGAGLNPAMRDMESVAPAASKRTSAGPVRPRRKRAAPTQKSLFAIKPTAAEKSRGISEPSDEEIRLRAYFIGERRMRLSLPGDSTQDWIEARRQLAEEARRRAP